MAANVGGKSVVGGGAGAGGTTGGGAAACRASGSRWTPTPEQIRILKELYYGCGIRSPNSEQIQRITAMLRQHGKIEGKNVFYWFQNHKARERQKRRLTNLDVNVPAAAAADVGHLGVLSLSSPSGAAPPSSPLGLYPGNGGASALQLDTSSDWGSTTAVATETCFLQDYMGVMRSTAGHHDSSAGGAAASPWACFSSPDSWAAAPAMTRAPETLPLFPTGDNVQPPRPRRGAPAGDAIRGGGGGSGYLPTLPFWGAAATAATATTTTTSVTIQQQHHQLLQLQDQYSFYTTNSQPPSSHDASSAATASLELSLSSWCSPYPAGTM
ncbi:hypothetical protein SETIT_3G027800v2 [Setaria italica]|uniref:Homeobox domain-containing protein n=1 Tax=Setaria italica TaxID=4555 RepID=K3ZCE4_SETIT|nr:WUSCHEL-related homeobox 1B [Setaria italica]RCV15049.1 hypothetical protein SETIT_3G027800v2 [Setaria italica]